MANYGAKILNNAVSSLLAQQGIIANTSNNIANVNTEGYSRRVLNLETRTGRGGGQLSIGNGVDIGSLTRVADNYIETQLQKATADSKSGETVNQFLSRVDPLFDLSGEQTTIGSALTGFFTAVEDVAANPSSIELRATFIERATDLTDSIRNTYNSLAQLQDEAGQRLTTEVASVNSLTSQIAELNARIAGIEGPGNLAADERDRRDLLVKQLSEKLSFTTLESSDGQISVNLANGFALVSGPNNRELSVTSNPSFAAGTLPQSLSGGVLSYVVYDYSNGAGTAHTDFTQSLMNQDGTIGGLLKVRGYVDPALTQPSPFQANGHLVEIAQRVEAIATTLLTVVNQTYLGPIDSDPVTVGFQPSSGDLDGNQPGVYGLFDFEFAGVKDTDGSGIPDDIGTHAGIGNYSSRITFGITDPRAIAAAYDDVNVSPAVQVFAPGDGRNMQALADLRTSAQTFNAGSFSLTGTFEDAYTEAVVTVSNKRSRAELNFSVAQSKLLSAEGQRDALSSVSLDEEFTSLIRFQKAFQAAARLVKTAEALMDEIVNLV